MDRSGPGHYPFIMRFTSTPSSLPLALLLAAALSACGGPSVDDDAGTIPHPDAGDAGVDAAPIDLDSGTDSGPPIETDAGPMAVCGDDAPPPSDPSTGSWSAEHYLAGINGPVNALARTAGGHVIIGGEFTVAGTDPATNVVRWTGTAFEAMGDGTAHALRDLAVDGSGAIWGLSFPIFDFTTGGQTSVIYRWDDPTWTEVDRTTESALTLAVDPEGALLIGGAFTDVGGSGASHLARWNGAAFEAVSAEVPDGSIEVILADAAGLCVGGNFTMVGAVAANSVACRVGGVWESRGLPDPFFMVKALARDDGGALIAGGHFDFNDDGTGSIARWNGSGWDELGGGLRQPIGAGYVETIVNVAGQLFVAGRFIRAGAVETVDVAAWDGTSWSALDGGLPKTTFGIGLENVNVADAVAADGSVYFGGQFSRAGRVTALGVARWDGTMWRALQEPDPSFIGGVNGAVYALGAYGDCGLYVGGQFASAGNVSARNIAQLTADGWEPLGDGLADPITTLLVTIARGPDASEGVLGDFGGPGGALVFAGLREDVSGDLGHLVVWNGASWASVGGGFDAAVNSLAVDAAGNLYAGGDFTALGDGSRALHVARWDGSSWAPLGDGLDGDVRVVAFAPDGTLYAGGYFTGALATWDGSSWNVVGGGLEENATVHDLSFRDGDVYVAGWFDATASGADARNVVRWDGTAFHELDVLDGIVVTDIEWVGDHLFVAGLVDRLDGGFGSQIMARWDGTAWSALDGEPSDLVEDLLLYDGALWVGGLFTGAGEHVSLGVASYRFTP